MTKHQTYSGLGGHSQERPAATPLSARFVPSLIAPTSSSKLEKLTFAAQDLFEVEGRIAGFGHPDWQLTHQVSKTTAPAVQTCLNAGAELVGMTISDELAFSINGTHAFFETPPNPNAHGHGPGGSSGGSASIVGMGNVDFALGPDVRAPSSYCGVYGFRSSTHLLDTEGMLPLAPSFDAVGWFANDAEMLQRVGRALLPTPSKITRPRRLVVARDAVASTLPAVQEEMERVITDLSSRFEIVEEITLAPETLTSWAADFATIQAAESWRYNGEWIVEHGVRLSADVRSRFERGIEITEEMEAEARKNMETIAERVATVLGDDGVLLIPTAPFPAPQLNVPNTELEPYRPKMLELTSISGLAGIPQLCLPLIEVDEKPVGVSLLSPRNTDAMLLDLGAELCSL